MPVLLNKNSLDFPDASFADENGILAVGGDLSSSRILSAYQKGIFPWPAAGYELLWFCPDPRFVLNPLEIKINQSLKKAIKKSTLTLIADTDFLAVIRNCQKTKRKEDGSWISEKLIQGYYDLHKKGFAHSIEAYDKDELVGGLYGVSLGNMFFGESMFHTQNNASKICFVTLMAHLIKWQITLVDCQAHTDTLGSFGAKDMQREIFLQKVNQANKKKTKLAPWKLELLPLEALEFILNKQKKV